jgi:hypothetical protein
MATTESIVKNVQGNYGKATPQKIVNKISKDKCKPCAKVRLK